MSDYKNLYDAWQETKRQLTEANGKLLAIVSALEIDESAINLEAGQLKLIVEAVVKQAKQLTETKRELAHIHITADEYYHIKWDCGHIGAYSPRRHCPYCEISNIADQLTEAKERVDSLRLTLIETQAELQRHNAIMVDNGVRAEKAEQERDDWKRLAEERGEALISVTETLKECNSVLPTYADLKQENKRLQKRIEELEEFKEEDVEYFNQHELAWEEVHKHLKDTSGMDLPTAIKAIAEQTLKNRGGSDGGNNC